jgi:alkylation response protein AidB-like acyl-CoA dehydrogenase
MHLDGYGCAGMTAVAYGLACLELEAVDSGLRSFVSVQGSLAMAAIHKHGSEEQKQEWLPRLASGEAIGCFGLTEPDHGSDPGTMATRTVRDGSDWVLNGAKMWITNGSLADAAVVWARTEDGVRGFLVPGGTPGFSTHDIKKKLSLRASVTSELVLTDCRLPADAMLPADLRGDERDPHTGARSRPHRHRRVSVTGPTEVVRSDIVSGRLHKCHERPPREACNECRHALPPSTDRPGSRPGRAAPRDHRG